MSFNRLTRNRIIICSAALMAVGLLGGCNNKGPGVTTYPVSGTVTYNGKPVNGAVVALISKNPDAPRSTGVTDAEGKFSVTTYFTPKLILKGAVPDDYRVSISKEPGPDNTGLPTGDVADPDYQKAAMQRMIKMAGPTPGAAGRKDGPPAPPKPKPEIPLKYANPETSGFSATVVTGENDPLEFKMVD